MRRWRWLAALLFLALLSACSMTRVAYSNATPLLTWAIDDYFDLSDGQKDWVHARTEKLIKWHRQSELPDYERFLQATLAMSERPFTAADASRTWQEGRALFLRLVEQALPDMADFLLDLDAGQLAALEANLAKANAKLARETLKGSPEERRQRRAAKTIEYFEDYLGRLSGKQAALVTQRVQAIPEVGEAWLADRKFRQQEVIKLIRNKGTHEQTVAGLRRVLLEMDSLRRPDYVALVRNRDARMFELVAAMSETLSPEQRAKLQRKIRGYIADVAYLMLPS